MRKKKEDLAATIAKIKEARKNNFLGPDVSIRDLIEDGRRF